MNHHDQQGAISIEGWHLKKEIQFGHIITTLTVAVAAMFYFSKIEQRIALVEQQMTQQRERDDRQDKAVAEAVTLLRQQLENMDKKLDRVLERR